MAGAENELHTSNAVTDTAYNNKARGLKEIPRTAPCELV